MNETEKPEKKPAKRIIDVEQPGTSAPAATSKPVLVTNRPLLQDPMMVPENTEKSEADSPTEDNSPETASEKVMTGGRQVIAPLDETLNEDTTEVPESDQEDKASDADVTASSSSAEPAAVEPTETTPASDSAAEQPAIPDTTDSVPATTEDVQAADEAPAPDAPKGNLAQQADAEAVAKAKHDADIQQLIDGKRYVLPINTIESRKSKRFVVLGAALALVLIIIWLDIALDAGIIKLGGLKPLTHFFSN